MSDLRRTRIQLFGRTTFTSTSEHSSYAVRRDAVIRRMRVHIPPHCRPVPALMHHPVPAGSMFPNPTRIFAGCVLFESGIRTAQHALPQVAQTMLDVVREARAIRDEADTDDVQAVQLVHHRDLERAIIRAHFAEAVGLEERAPLVVVEQSPVIGVLPDETDAPDLDGQLVRMVVAPPC